MSKLVAQFDPSAGSGSFLAGAVNRCSSLWLMNESANFLKLDFAAADTPKIIQPWCNRLLKLTNPVQTVSWSVVATLQSDSPPVSLVFVELYDPSEDTSALLSGPLQRQTNVGNAVQVNSATTTIERDLLTPWVLTGLAPTVDHSIANQLDVTAGIAYPQQSDGSLLRQTPTAATFQTSVPNTTYFLDLNPDGSWSWGLAHSSSLGYLAIAQVVTDASGNIFSATDVRVINTTLLQATSGYVNIQAPLSFGTAISGSQSNMNYDAGAQALEFASPQAGAQAQGIRYITWDGAGAKAPFSIGGQFGGSAAWIDAAGVLHAPAPVQLISGNQETGNAAVVSHYTTGAGLFAGNGVNFKSVMTNAPTSVTLTAAATQNANTPTIENITLYGFTILMTNIAAGFAKWEGKYTTVGNCLLAVDAAERTFDHHCDRCGHQSTATPLEALNQQREPFVALSYVCPECGAIEAFNVALTANDEADPTPQGSGAYATTRGAQATLIRQLMTALGLEVAA